MRWLLPILLLASCSPSNEAEPVNRLYAGEGRDRLCLDGDRFGLIAYGAGDANCSARGLISRSSQNELALTPAGDEDCRISATEEGDSIRLGPISEACAYYCGPGADFSGKSFTERPEASPAVDFAGDPLC